MSRQRVVTVSEDELPGLANALMARMIADGFAPEALVGIATGGALVVQSIPDDVAIKRFTCTMRRPGTATKQKLGVTRLLKRLPYGITNLLRILEDRARELSTSAEVPDPSPSLLRSIEAIADEVAHLGICRIAVIDDAVDSGATLACVMGALRDRLPPEVEMRSGVIAQTWWFRRTICQPDFAIYEKTNCRFFWSYDYRSQS